MTDRYIFLESADMGKPGTWKGTLNRGKRSALACCPNGHVASLSGHDIAEDGQVSPSVDCPYDDCDFHRFVILEGWKP